ncbi:MAG: hypothetical protein IJS74_03640 [Clostridia bacterium]|nr:hypothetical protein [Clostridia bacterium]
MKETEITVQVFDSFDNIDKILKQEGFVVTRKFLLDDHYFTSLNDIKDVEFKNIIKNSVLIRKNESDEICIEMLYKNKEFDDAGNVVCEEKVKVNISDLEKAVSILTLAGFNNFVNCKQNCYVYKNDELELCLQIVDNLGIFIEYEEDESVKDLLPEEKIEVMKNKLKKLGLQLGEDFSCKKVFMLLHK